MIRQALLKLAGGVESEIYAARLDQLAKMRDRAISAEARAGIAEHGEREQRARHAREMADLRAQMILTVEPRATSQAREDIARAGVYSLAQRPAPLDAANVPTG